MQKQTLLFRCIYLRLAKTETGQSIKKAVKKAAFRGASNFAEDLLKGKDIKSSIKQNAKNASSEAISDVAVISANALKRKLDEGSASKKKPKKNKKQKQRGLGFDTLFG